MSFRNFIGGLALSMLVATLANAWQEVEPPPTEQAAETEAVDPQDEDLELNIGNGMTQEYVRMQTTAVKAELELIASKMGFDSEWLPKVEKAMETEVTEAANRMAEDMGNTMVFSQSLEADLAKRLYKMVEADVPAAKQALWKSYLDNVTAFNELKRKVGIEGMVVFLDTQLCLSPDQIETIRGKLAEVWKPDFDDGGSMAPINGLVGGTGILDAVAEDVWEEVYTESQLEVFKKIDETSNLMMTLQLSAWGQGEPPTAQIREMCDDVFDLKFEEYDSLVGISEAQRKRLQVARKGATVRVTKRCQELMKDFSENANAMGMNMDLMMESMEPMVNKCIRQTAWSRTVEKVFDEEQLKKIKAREDLRKETAGSQILEYIVFAMTNQAVPLALDIEQHRSFVKLLHEKTGTDHDNYLEIIKVLYELEEKDYREVLTEEQWEKFEPSFREHQEMMKKELSDSDESEDSGADEEPDRLS